MTAPLYCTDSSDQSKYSSRVLKISNMKKSCKGHNNVPSSNIFPSFACYTPYPSRTQKAMDMRITERVPYAPYQTCHNLSKRHSFQNSVTRKRVSVRTVAVPGTFHSD